VFDGHTAQVLPDEPHAPSDPPPTQLPFEQQPPRHSCVGLHEVVHFFSVASQALPTGQSVAELQPHWPDVRHALPLALPAQLTQTLPAAPHTCCVVPGMQLPIDAEEQQPDRQVIVDEQVLKHTPAVHAVDVLGQSAGNAAQPHCPPPETTVQTWPFWLLVPSPHRLPLLPQTCLAVPVWQVPPVAAVQQPPLHGVLLSHAAPHLCVVGLHAWFAGQSLALMQPHAVVVPTVRQALPLPAQLPQVA
jgi:hypothetical protein